MNVETLNEQEATEVAYEVIQSGPRAAPKFATRGAEKLFLKSEISRLLKEIGVSHGVFKRTLPRMSGTGYKYKVNQAEGGKPSLRQKYQFLVELQESLKDNDKIDVEYPKEIK